MPTSQPRHTRAPHRARTALGVLVLLAAAAAGATSAASEDRTPDPSTTAHRASATDLPTSRLPRPGTAGTGSGDGTAGAPSSTALHGPWLPAPLAPGRGFREWGWHAWLGTETGVVLVTALLLPLAVAAVCGVAWWRRRSGIPPARAWRWAACEVGIVYGTAPFVWMTMLPAGGRAHGAVSLVPLRDLATMSTFQVVGNLLLFAALAFLAPVRLGPRVSVLRVTAVAAGCSALIEVAQHVLPLDRVSSVDDVLLNATGAAVAALASTALVRGAALVRGRGARHPATTAVDA